MENLTGGTPPVRYLLCVVPCKLYFSTIQIWMTLLSEDEAFVTRRHLIEGIDIPRIVVEYGERWGNEFAKTERTIKSYQRRAIQKIECFEQNKRAFLENISEK